MFIERVSRGEPVTLFGDGQQTRDFVYVGDLAGLLVLALLLPETVGQTINVGRGQPCSLIELLEALEKRTGTPVARQLEAARLGDIVHLRADISRLVGTFGKAPATDIVTGLGAILRYRNG
jgi:UDP-glucose 4-epimerase